MMDNECGVPLGDLRPSVTVEAVTALRHRAARGVSTQAECWHTCDAGTTAVEGRLEAAVCHSTNTGHNMGNVQVLTQASNNGELTQFQRNKLLFDFDTFFDLNNDGYLSYKVHHSLHIIQRQGKNLFPGFPVGQGSHLSDVRVEDELRQVQSNREAVYRHLEQPGADRGH